MSNRILTAACVLIAALPVLTSAQQAASDSKGHREGSFEFTFAGGLQLQDDALRDFLGSGSPTSRFATSATPSNLLPSAEFRLGYNINRHLGVSVNGGAVTGSGVTYLSPSGAITFTTDLNARTSPFVLVGTELTRITGENDRMTHSTWGLHAGLGIRRMVSENLAVRAEARMLFAGYREMPMRSNSTTSPMLHVGLSYFTRGRAPQVAMIPMPMRTDTVRTVRVDTLRSFRVDTLRSVRRDTVQAPPVETTDQVVLRVQFQTDRSELLPISYAVLRTVAAAIKATPGSRWAIEGHTDSIGTDSANQVLSQARAQTVVDYLVTQGVDRSILRADGFGESRPIFSNTTLAGRAQNRRVQLRRRPLPPAAVVP